MGKERDQAFVEIRRIEERERRKRAWTKRYGNILAVFFDADKDDLGQDQFKFQLLNGLA